MSTSDEGAKAVQEIAKTTAQGIELVQKIGSFFARVMGEPIDTTVGMLTDTLKFKRWERQVRLIDRVNDMMRERNVGHCLRPLPPKLALPIFHHASLEDDDSLHDLWAQLLVTAVDSQSPPVRHAFVEILASLEPFDAVLLQRLHDEFVAKQEYHRTLMKGSEYKMNWPPTHFEVASTGLRKGLACSDEAYWTSVDNLRRLSLCQSYIEEGDIEIKEGNDSDYHDVVIAHGDYRSLCITSMGVDFVRACKGHK